MKTLIVNICSCGQEYTLETWTQLPKLGYQEMTDGHEPTRYEMRNCLCGSTRSIGVDKNGEYYDENE